MPSRVTSPDERTHNLPSVEFPSKTTSPSAVIVNFLSCTST